MKSAFRRTFSYEFEVDAARQLLLVGSKTQEAITIGEMVHFFFRLPFRIFRPDGAPMVNPPDIGEATASPPKLGVDPVGAPKFGVDPVGAPKLVDALCAPNPPEKEVVWDPAPEKLDEVL